jgi:hypothetical protein
MLFCLEGILLLVMSDVSPMSTYLKWALLHRKYAVFSVMGGDVFLHISFQMLSRNEIMY